MKMLLTIAAVLCITALMLTANKFLPGVALVLNKQPFINAILKYQLLVLLFAVATLFITLKVTPNSKSLLAFGNMSVIAEKERWLGINGKSTWKTNGLQLLFFISIATGLFMFMAVKYSNSIENFRWSFVPLVLIIALSNSFSEEIIYRFAINGNLMNGVSKLHVLLISAILFGFPHFGGWPGGVTGVVMAGLLGYILSKATYETQGMGFAWAIHFVQDIIIFTALFMMNIKH